MSTANSDNHDLPSNWEDLAEEAAPVEPTDDDELVCPKCFTPIDSSAHLCRNCGGPVSSRAFIDPFASIWGEGYGYRQLTRVDSRPSLPLLIGIWVIFVPAILMMMINILHIAKQWLDETVQAQFGSSTNNGADYLFGILICSLFMAIQIAIIRRVTINYQRAQLEKVEKESLA